MIDLGDVVVLRVEVRDENGDLADAGAVACTVTLPDRTTSTPTPTKESTGVYQIAYTPTALGHHKVAWTATGANASSYRDAFNVGPDTNIISLADGKAALNFSGTTEDEEVRDYIAAATDAIEQLIGPVVPRSITETVTTGGKYLVLVQRPVVEVTAISSLTGSGVTYDVDDLLVYNADAGLITMPNGTLAADTYSVTYVAGRAVIPSRWVQACRVLLQHMWATQRGSSSPGRRRGEALDEYQPGNTYTIPNRVLELLQLDTHGPLVG